MTIVTPVAAIDPMMLASLMPQTQSASMHSAPAQNASGPASFSNILLNGLQAANDKVAHAEKLVKAFATDDSIPVHQVTFALEEARMSFEMMMQVRSRMLEAYQQFMNMQL